MTISSPTMTHCAIDTLLVRPLDREHDRERLRGLCGRLSARSRHQRFLGVLNNLSEAFLTHLLDVDHEDREAIVALEGDDIVAVARYAISPLNPDEADVAALVVDDWQHRGLGRKLTGHLEQLAVARGVQVFNATTLGSNLQAKALIFALFPNHQLGYTDGNLHYHLVLNAKSSTVHSSAFSHAC
jgi:GNAT superfamily N-acetyltransferase